jgi:ADP-ribosylglycohydrolase
VIEVIERTKIAGALYGVALGDALGRDTEFVSTMKEIWKRFGRSGHMRLPYPALFTDDTQMALAVARALRDARSLTPRELAHTTSREFIRWARLDDRRAPGVTCMRAVAKLARGARWQDATVINSKGCGANMRVAPAAFIADYPTAVGYAQLQGALTHGHPTAIAASELTALAIRWAAEGVPVRQLPERLLDHALRRRTSYERGWLGKLDTRHWWKARLSMKRGWRENASALVDVVNALRKTGTVSDPCTLTGAGWVAEEALATALFCAVRYWHDPVEAISAAARTTGDSDSIASITGAILGAANGVEAWPVRWRYRIERRAEIEEAIDVVHALS